MDISLIVEIGKAIHTLKSSFDTVEKYGKAVDRANRGKNPFLSKPEVEAALKKLNKLRDYLHDLAKKGLGKYETAGPSMDELANPESRDNAVQKFKTTIEEREHIVTKGEELQLELQKLSKEAPRRAKVLREIRDFFRDVMKLPQLQVSQLMAFEYYQLFERASGHMGNVGRAATRALNRITPELKEFKRETSVLKDNLHTFGLI